MGKKKKDKANKKKGNKKGSPLQLVEILKGATALAGLISAILDLIKRLSP